MSYFYRILRQFVCFVNLPYFCDQFLTMSILKKIFGEKPKETVSKLKWIPLTELSQLIEISNSEKTVGVFKHSTRCSISSMVKRQFERGFELEQDQIDMYYLDLIAYREISNEVAQKYRLQHESPQLLIIKNDKLVAEGSHSGILNIDLSKLI